MKKFAFLAVSAVLVLAGCSKNGENQTSTNGNPVEFRTVIDKTRASLIDTKDDLTSFFVHGDITDENTFVFMNAAVYNEGGAWTYAPKKYWPTTAGATVDFYAYAPIKDKNMTTPVEIDGSGDVTFGYTVPTGQNASNKAVDLLVALAKGQDKSNDPVNLTFGHALSAVTFSAENQNAATSELIYTISEIRIENLDNEGVYTYGTGWEPANTFGQKYYAGLPVSGVAVNPGAGSVGLLSANDYMMVLPQVAAAKEVIIIYSLKSGDGQYIYKNEERILALPAGFEFEEGKRYNFKFSFTASDLIVFDVIDVTAWTDTPQAL